MARALCPCPLPSIVSTKLVRHLACGDSCGLGRLGTFSVLFYNFSCSSVDQALSVSPFCE